MLSSCVGPLISIVLFVYWGDDWELLDLKNVMVVGMGLELVAAGVMFFFDDDWALKERGEGEIVRGAKDGDTTTHNTAEHNTTQHLLPRGSLRSPRHQLRHDF